MKLYGAMLSPFVRKVAVVLTEKGISFDLARGGPISDALGQSFGARRQGR